MSKSIYIFGFHSIESVLSSSPELVIRVLIQKGRKDKRIINLTNTLNSHKILYSISDKFNLDKISKGEVHQGVVSEVMIQPIQSEESFFHSIAMFDQKSMILILDSKIGRAHV